MTVNIGTIPVNPNGSNEPQSGWTQAHVMDALEKTFYQMGWNSGTQKNGVPIAVLFPGYNTSSLDDFNKCIQNVYVVPPEADGDTVWKRCGGDPPVAAPQHKRYFYVTNSGTQSYQIAEELVPTSWGVNGNVITVNSMGDNFITETKLTYNGQGTDIIQGLSSGNVYYMRKWAHNQITLHNTASDAQTNSNPVTVTAVNLNDPLRFRTDAQTNPSITMNRGDDAYFYTYATTDGGDFRVCDFKAGSSYSSDRHYHDSTNNTNTEYDVTGSGTWLDPYYWTTKNFFQTENEVFDPTQITDVGYQGIYAYGYANSSNALMKGTIILNPVYNDNNQNWNNRTYWKYTVPASGSRTELKLRIYRDDYSTDAGRISGIMICSEATGWSDNEVFTIPGTAIGGASPANDIEFGVNTNETSTGTADGKCSILTTNLGSGANMFQKHPDGGYGVLRLENDSTKKFGVTYWGFSLLATNNYQMVIQCGSGWSYLNRLGKHFNYSSSYEGHFGCFNGELGLDYQLNNNSLHRSNNTYFDKYQYATSNGPTTYPMKIKYYKAQAPQDANFSIIQFVQTINSIDIPFFTFNLNKGTNFGSSVWDLNKVWNGSYTNFTTNDIENGSTGSRSNWVETQYTTPGYHQSQGVHYEPVFSNSLAREANYGYLRGSDQSIARTRYVSNIDTNNTAGTDQVYTYFRSSAYDKHNDTDDSRLYNYADRMGTVGVDYHKPIKGLPINNQLIPCPYYMPDDFVMIQAEVTPGATLFRTGDTITVSGTEIYEIIIADNTVNQTGLDKISNNTANGMIFAARTT